MYFATYLKAFFSTLTLDWLAFIAAVAIGLFVFWFYMKRKKRISAHKAIAGIVLLVYLIIVFAATVFAREPGDKYQYELMLFWSYYEVFAHGKISLFWENIGNILMLLPYGFLLPLIDPCGMGEKGKSVRITIETGFLCTLTIELLQLIFKRGLFEFDDIVHNTLGVGIGYLFYILLRKHFKTI